MKTYIAILRGINVSGHKMIKMETLRSMMEQSGYKQVKTYIQSGNIVFRAPVTPPATLATAIEKAILDTFGFEVPVIVTDAGALRHILEYNPFINDRQEPVTHLHVTLLSGQPPAMAAAIPADKYLPDEYVLVHDAVYLYCPGGYGNTKLNNSFFEKKLQVTATTRNWKTLQQLAALAATVEESGIQP